MNSEKLTQIVTFLDNVRTVLDGGYHYSSPFLRTRGDADGLAPPVLREKPDALGLLEDIVADLMSLAQSLDALDDEAKQLKVDTRAMCGADLSLYTKIYDQLATDVGIAVQNAIERLTSPNGTINPKPERKPRTPRTPKTTQVATQTSLLPEAEQPATIDEASDERAIPTGALE